MAFLYSTYQASFTTKAGTGRLYDGSALSLSWRRRTLQKDGDPQQPVWLRAGHKDFKMSPVCECTASTEAALVLEAMQATKTMSVHPKTARGGPWLLITPPDQDWIEIDL
eukprot:12249948-Karenia_brevis.AAC.1